jgi:hypothetical protein
MAIDPDGCRFWYTQEYYETSGTNWQTRIGSFSFPSCFKATQTITFAALAGKTFGDADFTVSASASSGLPVSFAATGNCTLSAATVHLTGVGSCKVTASQAGDANTDAAADVAQTFAIAKGSQTITFAALAAKTFGNADFSVAATSSSGLAVSFVASGTCSVSGAVVHLTAPGPCTVTASQTGDANYNAAADVAQTFRIAKASQRITFRRLPNKILGAANFRVSARASSGLRVVFRARGRCTVRGTKVHLIGLGWCTMVASQRGNANYSAAKSVLRSFKVTQRPSR